jgi:uncharacterized protein YkwD
MRRLRVLFFCTVALVLFGTTSSQAAAAPAGGGSRQIERAISTSSYGADGEECAFLGLVNGYRKSNGLGSLTITTTLGAAAEHHSADMVAHGYFSHTMSDGSDWADNIAAHGYPTNSARGENIAAGYAEAAKAFEQWRNSPSHDAQMLGGKYNAIGIGRVYGASARYGWYWTTTFGSVVDKPYSCSGGSTGGGDSALGFTGGGRTSSSTPSGNAIDGKTSTSWHTTTTSAPRYAYVYFDLGKTRSISKITWMFSQGGSADRFKVQVSTDKVNWRTLTTRTRANAGAWQSASWQGQTRYVRFYFENPNKDLVLGYLCEVKAYA